MAFTTFPAATRVAIPFASAANRGISASHPCDSSPAISRQFRREMAGELSQGWDAEIPRFAADAKGMATRVAAGKVVNAIAPRVPALLGGSADLDPSTYTELKGMGNFAAKPERDRQGGVEEESGYTGRNLHFGVREHAM